MEEVKLIDRTPRNDHKPIAALIGSTFGVLVPEFDINNQGQKANFGKILGFCCEMLGISKGDLKITRDPELGKEIKFPAKIERAIDTMIAFKKLPLAGLGEASEYRSALKANLCESLALIRVLKRNSMLVRKQAKDCVSVDKVRKNINIKMGFEEPGLEKNLWVVRLIKFVLGEVVRETFPKFPGEWMHSLRVRNDCKSDTAVLARAGYSAICASPIKIKTVLLNTVRKVDVPLNTEELKKSKLPKGSTKEITKVVNFSDEKLKESGTDFREFRAGVTTLLPFIDPSGDKSPQDQLPSDTKPDRAETLAFYRQRPELVNALNLAFAIKTTVDDKKRPKSTPAAFELTRNAFINACANVGFQDSVGKTYEKYLDIPEHTRKYLEKVLCKKIATDEERAAAKATRLSKEKVVEKTTPLVEQPVTTALEPANATESSEGESSSELSEDDERRLKEHILKEQESYLKVVEDNDKIPLVESNLGGLTTNQLIGYYVLSKFRSGKTTLSQSYHSEILRRYTKNALKKDSSIPEEHVINAFNLEIVPHLEEVIEGYGLEPVRGILALKKPIIKL
jgi:hypothetical protein